MKKIIKIIWILGILFQIGCCVKIMLGPANGTVIEDLRILPISLVSALPGILIYLYLLLRKAFTGNGEEDAYKLVVLPIMGWPFGFLPIFLASKANVDPKVAFMLIGILVYALIFFLGFDKFKFQKPKKKEILFL